MDSRLRPEIMKSLEENIGRAFFDINFGHIFLDLSSKVKQIKVKINKQDPIKLNAFCSVTQTSTKQKDNTLNGRNYL